MDVILFAIGALLFAAHFFTTLFRWTRIPDVLLLMLIGIIVGPVLQIVAPDDFGKVGTVLTTIALVLILFEGGVGLEVPTVLRSARDTLAISVVTMLVTVVLSTLVMVFFFQTSWLAGMALGTIIGGTSAAVVVPLVHELKLKEPAGTALILESSLTDVLTIVLTYGILEAMASEHVVVGKMAGELLSAFFLSTLLGVVAGHVWLFLLNRVRHFPNTIFTTFAFLFILYGFVEMIGFSGAVASLVFGMTLTNFRYFGFSRLPGLKGLEWSRLSETDRLFHGEIIFLVKVFFFVYLGINMHVAGSFPHHIPLLLTAAIFGTRFLVTKAFVPRQTPQYERSIMSVMVPKGLAAAVLAGLPAHYGIAEAGLIEDVVHRVILFSIMLTAIGIPLIARWAKAPAPVPLSDQA
jgi:NhaP-type Na+/H+ or K+/H+ antiporter